MNIFEQALEFWDAHGTKALGQIGSLTALLLGLKAQFPELFGAKTTTAIAVAGFVIGQWTSKRGVYNTDQIAQKVVDKQIANNSAAQTPPPT